MSDILFKYIQQEQEVIPCHLQDHAPPETVNEIAAGLGLPTLIMLIEFDLERLKRGGAIPHNLNIHLDSSIENGRESIQAILSGDLSEIQVFNCDWLKAKHHQKLCQHLHKYTDDFEKILARISFMLNRFNIKRNQSTYVKRYSAKIIIDSDSLSETFFFERNSALSGMFVPQYYKLHC